MLRRIDSIVLTVYCLTPETLHTLREEETTHIIITAGLGVPFQPIPLHVLQLTSIQSREI